MVLEVALRTEGSPTARTRGKLIEVAPGSRRWREESWLHQEQWDRHQLEQEGRY